jgi:hypothetical protein
MLSNTNAATQNPAGYVTQLTNSDIENTKYNRFGLYIVSTYGATILRFKGQNEKTSRLLKKGGPAFRTKVKFLDNDRIRFWYDSSLHAWVVVNEAPLGDNSKGDCDTIFIPDHGEIYIRSSDRASLWPVEDSIGTLLVSIACTALLFAFYLALLS